MTRLSHRERLAGRPKLRSPGRPPVGRREDRQRFWAAIARGCYPEAAVHDARVSWVVGARWFRQAGGMPPSQSRWAMFRITRLSGVHARY